MTDDGAEGLSLGARRDQQRREGVSAEACNPIGSSGSLPRGKRVGGTNASSAVRLNTRSDPLRPVSAACAFTLRVIGTRRTALAVFGTCPPSFWSYPDATRIVVLARSTSDHRWMAQA